MTSEKERTQCAGVCPSVRMPRVAALGMARFFALLLVACAACLHASSTAQAGVVDDFQDGDWTADPTWVVIMGGGDAEVLPDPLRSGNLALQGYRITGDQRMRTPGPGMPFWGIDLRLEFLAPTESFGAFFMVTDGDYHFGVGVDDPSPPHEPYPFLSLYMGEGDGHYFGNSVQYVKSIEEPVLGEWWQVRVRHDQSLHTIQVEARLLSDNSLLAELTVPDTDWNNHFPWAFPWDSEASSAVIAFKSADPCYLDHLYVGTVPEPTLTWALVMGACALALRGRRIAL